MNKNAVLTESEQISSNISHGNLGELLQTVVLAFSVTGICYYSYYLLAPWIWSQNIPFNSASITPWIRIWTGQQDGVEIYALYILVFINCASAVILSRVLQHCRKKIYCNIVVAICSIVSAFYFSSIGFSLPINSLQNKPLIVEVIASLFIMSVVFSTVAFLYYLQRYSFRWTITAVSILLAPACFIATDPIFWNDYTYIFAPALRLLKGAPLHNIYFQYDPLLSLLAAGWMQLGFDLNTFQTLGQASYYTTILGVFLLSKKLFQKRELSLFLLIALILGRIYATPYDIVFSFQVTPLRLDLWLILAMVVFYLGPYHWASGVVCGLLLLLHKNFGILYSIAYLQLLITLFTISYFNNKTGKSLPVNLFIFFKNCFIPVMIILFFIVISYFIFKNDLFGGYSGYFQKIGIGFMQIAANSFYWYIPPIFSIVVILLIKLHNNISTAYMNTVILLVYCAIGNSTYFFGRSHEHNIINISIVLILVFFIMLDLITRFVDVGRKTLSPSLFQRYGVNSMAIVMIAILITSYLENILVKLDTQIRNISNVQLIYPPKLDLHSLQEHLNKIKTVTENSNKIYFVDGSDFELYYYGDYTPVGYCNPFKTFVFTADLHHFLQNLLDKGYYLVCSDEMKYLLADLNYNHNVSVNSSVVISNLPTRIL